MNIDLSKYKLKKIVSVKPGKKSRVFDIEVNSKEHAFIAKSPSGAVGISHNSALISLSNLSDERMRHSKSGQWWLENPQRALANNSAAYTEKPDLAVFIDEWKSLYQSRSGERGLFNREAAHKQSTKNGRRDTEGWELGTNPCGEILLRNQETCNLSEVIIRPNDTLETLKKKVRLASILGTFQSCLTNFRYLTPSWKRNCEEERLLGVSLTGIFDNVFMSKPSSELKNTLNELRDYAIDINKQYAKKLGINQSVAVTCIKPSGTVSSLVDSSSGIHPRHSRFYFRTIRASNLDPLCSFMKSKGFYHEPCTNKPDNTTIFYFPMKSPKTSKFRSELSALDHLELWRIYKNEWAEHTVSITISVKEHEWLGVAAYVYEHFDDITGISFLPYTDHVYNQAPFIEVTEEKYLELLDKTPSDVDWSELSKLENTDKTEGSQELACSGGKCEI